MGAGPGGYVAAIRARQLGRRVTIVESGEWGGVCLNVGCIPSKVLLNNAALTRTFATEREALGIRVSGEVTFDYGAAFKRSRDVVAGRVRGLEYLFRKNGIDRVEGWGELVDSHTLSVRRKGQPDTTLTFENLILATGAVPRLLPGTRVGPRMLTYREAILAPELPRSVVIIGGGPIGVEFAYIYASYGVQVTIIEALNHLLPTEDGEVAVELERAYKRLGVRVHVGARVSHIEQGEEGVRVVAMPSQAKDGGSGGEIVVDADVVVQALGFRPRTEGYGLERLDINLTPAGGIAVDSNFRTSVPHVFAIGDVTGQAMLAHAAEAMGFAAAEALAGGHPHPVAIETIPRAVYGVPQVAAFGLTAEQAAARGLSARVFKFPLVANGKAQAMGHPLGFVKLVGDENGRLLGAHLVGPDVTELLPELTLAQAAELSVEEIAHNIHAHPTLSESVKDAALGLAGTSINL